MRIVFRNTDDSIGIITPTPETLAAYGIDSVARKDTPPGLPFWMVDDSEIPSDRDFRNAWEVPEDWGPPDGYGSRFSTFEEIEDAQDKQ